ncbi:Phosphatidylinositide phosphatase SAC1, partial [Nowakowskiella sp. JEL0078]
MVEHNPKTADSFKKHFSNQIQEYGSQIAVNLINKKGYEHRLGREFQKQITNLSDPNVKYVHFDFHQECKKMRWDRISILVKQIESDLKEQGYALVDENGSLKKSQTSVVRTNCMDCLDRTNVVQSVLARKILNVQMKELGILTGTQNVETSSFESVFKNIWADNADAISLQYSGSGALKTDFTRTGKRSTPGILQDGYNASIRYVKNNFLDGVRQ